jgi:hypothetical protein
MVIMSGHCAFLATRVNPPTIVGAVGAELRDGGMSLRQIVTELDKRNIRTMRGGAWTATTVRNLLLRTAGSDAA